MAKEGYKVSLNVYDLSQGLARQLSTTLLGKAIEGIWHTGLVVYGTEYNFGCGIQSAPVGTTPYGTPIRVVDLGVTHVPKDVFEMYLQEIGPRYTAETYSLLTHNCNCFSNEAAQFLVGASIPDYILNLPNEVMSSPMGALLLPMIQRLEATLRAGAVPQAPQFRPAMVAPPAQTGEATLRAGAVPQAPQFRPSMVAPPAQTGTSDRESLGASFDQLIRTKNEDVERESKREPSNCGRQQEKKDVSPACGAQEKTSNNGLLVDPLGDARNKVQEEISSEFSALMATGTIRASEAAALATKRVMQRYGHMNAEQS